MSESTSNGKEVLRQIIEGLEGVTPGPWDFDGPSHSHVVWSSREDRVCFMTSDGPATANARHIVACSPDRIRAIAEYVEALEKERDNARNDEWLAAISAVQFMSANWWQDCRSEVERNALQAVTEDVISALRSVGPTEYLDVQWKGAEAAMAAEEKAERLQRELSETEALREEGTAKITDLTLALSTARRTALLEAAEVCTGWLDNFCGTPIKYTSAENYASDAVRDIRDLLRAKAEGKL